MIDFNDLDDALPTLDRDSALLGAAPGACIGLLLALANLPIVDLVRTAAPFLALPLFVIPIYLHVGNWRWRRAHRRDAISPRALQAIFDNRGH